MMRRTKRYAIAAFVGSLALAACGGGDTAVSDADADGDGSVSMAEAGEAIAASDMKPRPGLYRVSTEITGMQMPGVPADMSGTRMGLGNSVEHCVTPAEAESGYAEMMKEGQTGSCTYDRFDLSGSSFDGVMVCSSGEGDMRITFDGTVTPTSSTMDARAAVEIPGMGQGRMDMRVTQERIRDCPG